MLDPLSIDIPLTQVKPEPERPIKRLLRQTSTFDYVLEIDYSAASAYMECPRKFENKFVFCREGDQDRSAQNFGTLFHKLEEARLRATPELPVVQSKLITDHFVKYPPAVGDHRSGERMHSVISMYNRLWQNDRWADKIYKDSVGPFIERPFKVELTTIHLDDAEISYPKKTLVAECEDPTMFTIHNVHVIYVGRLDTLLTENGLIFVPDHKTTSRGGQTFVNAFRLSNQTRGYAWAAQKLTGQTVAGAIINAAIVRPLTKTGTGTEFDRVTQFYSQDSLVEFEQNMKAIVSDIIHCIVRGYFPQHARSFKSPCDGCDYLENCTLPLKQRAADLSSSLYRNTTWNPMLET